MKIKLKPLILCILLLYNSGNIYPQELYFSIFGKVIDDVSGKPQDNVKVTIELAGPVVYTDINGKYNIFVSSGPNNITFKKEGFQKSRKHILIKSYNTRLDIALLPEEVYSGKEIVITALRPLYKKTEVSKAMLSNNEIKQVSGAKQDVFDAVKLMPGIAVANDYSAEFVVRGGDPDETGIFLDNCRVESPYHIEFAGESTSAGILTIFNNNMIKNVSLYTGGFPAKYGNAMSGIMDIETKKAGEGKNEGMLGISFIDTNFYYNCKINDKLGIIIAGRRNYFDLLLNLFVKVKTPDPEGSLSYVLPRFWDFHFKLDYDISKKDSISFYFLPASNYSRIDFDGIVTYPADTSGGFAGKTSDYLMAIRWDTREILSYLMWNHKFSDKFNLLWTVSYNQKIWNNLTRMKSTEPEADINSYTETLSRDLIITSEFIFKPNLLHEISWGVGFKPAQAKLDIKSVDIHGIDYNDITDHYTIDYHYMYENYFMKSYYLSGYIQDKIKITEKIYAHPGFRFDYLNWNGDYTISPRFSFSYGLNEKTTLRTAWGYFYQFPSAADFLPVYGGNPDLRSLLAEHKIISLESELPNNTSIKIEGYLKDYSRLISEDRTVPVNLAREIYMSVNGGRGDADGIEITLKNNSFEKYSGWLSYTLSKSVKKEKDDQKYYYSDYDRRHIFTSHLSIQPRKRINIGITWKLFSGIPYTPDILSTQEGGIYQYEKGSKNSARMPAYNRIDLRLSKDYVYRSWQMTLYAEIVNLLNNKNVGGYSWNPYEGIDEPSYMMPFIPFLGVEAKFN